MLLASLALAFQTTVSVGPGGAEVRTGDGRDSTGRREPRRIEVTEEHRRTAFKDPAARVLLLRARVARMQQDSMLISYEAKSYQRISVGLSLRETTRERLLFRNENASLVRWHRSSGVRVDVLGARAALPIAPEGEAEVNDEAGEMNSVPYYPGKEQLWVGGEVASAEVNDRELVHPIAEGSEAYYFFATGDSVILTLPDGKRLTLRELRITAREPRWNVIVGSFWFEVERGHLVRAAYRLSTPIDIWSAARAEDPTAMDDVPWAVRPLLTPMRAAVTAISIEYGLFEQRFWMPTNLGMDAFARVSFMRLPLRIEERFRYQSVNGLDSFPAPPIPAPDSTRAIRDSLYTTGMDTSAVRAEMRAFYATRDSLRRQLRVQQCADSGHYRGSSSRFGETTVVTYVPCDTAALRRSPELPASIYDRGEELFGVQQREELVKMLTMDLQPAWAPQPPRLEYGLQYTRFNRIEGLASGVALKSTLGQGYEAEGVLRASVADLQLNGELGLSRSNGRRTLRAGAYRRLVASSDFGAPLSFGASMPSFFYARDEGFYHRAWGGEVSWSRPQSGGLEWRLFSEQQWNAAVENRWSLFGGAHDDRFLGNVAATKGWFHGAAVRWRSSHGLNPEGWRLTTDFRLEGATGESDFARGLLETTVTRGLGPVAVSLTTAGGITEGELPPQRQFFLGGLHSVRGQTAGTAVGEAFWLGRFELGTAFTAARPVIFGDFGWAGPRDGWHTIVRPMSGAGIGASFLDGMVRLDLSRGIYPRWQTRLDLYLEARF
jgi:hypothetical protein